VGLTKFTEQLPIPPVIDATGGGTFALSMAPGLHQFHSHLPSTPTWGYAGAPYLGPTFEARRGVPVDFFAVNNLGPHPLARVLDTTLHGASEADKTAPRVSVHLHDGNTEPQSDGHPELTFRPGGTYQYHYTNDQQATTLWYHDHALGITRLNVYAGLAAFYLLRDELDTGRSDNPLGLPSGRYEIPIVIQDKMFNEDGTLAYPTGEITLWAPEFFGDVAIVNGKAWPNLDVDRGLYRFRLLNGSNARFYDLSLRGHVMFQIGTDGGLMSAPVPLNQIVLAPGERADVLIDFSKIPGGSKIQLINSAPIPFDEGARSAKIGGLPIREIMEFTVTGSLGFRGPIPESLRPVVPLPAPVKVRNVTLVEILDPETGEPLKVLLNNLPWETGHVETPKVDTVEQWNIINTTGDTHPIHLHLVQFQILGRQRFDVEAYLEAYNHLLPNPAGAEDGPWPAPSADPFARGVMHGPEPFEMGWKDIVQAHPGEITRIRIPFGANAAPGLPFGNSFTGEYVWHCHILEHEDNEMMLPYEILS
jgi:FtsP/CotA-like multicopper oxidase with cupredoxin domain